MIDPSKQYRDAGASDELATAIARAEQRLIERFGSGLEEQRQRLEALERASRELQAGPEFLDRLRANGVTRYRRGDLEIELAAAVSDAMTKFAAWPYAGIPANVPADGEPVGKCLKSVAMGLCAREHGHPGPCNRDDAPPPPDPPDEQPAVEIDFAATEELLRAQDARRRGQGA